MGQPLRVLIVEDSENDAELLLRKLRQGGFEPLHARVETAEEMGAALSSGAWDVILSDYKLPRFTGLQALALFLGKGLDIPFLMVSGNIGEDTAVETMKAGAHDYIMKDRLQRLVPAIRRELKDAEERRLRRQTEKALIEREFQYRELVARMSSAVVVYKVNEDGSDFIIADFNPAGERIEQIRKADIVNKSILDVFPGVVEFGLFAVLKRVWETGRPEHYPVSLYKDDRIVGWRENYVYKLSSGDIVAVYDDVTEKKKAEAALQSAAEKQRELTFIVNHSPATAWLWKAAAGWPVEYVSDNVAEFGYTADDFTSGRVSFASIIHPEDVSRVGAEVEEFSKEGLPHFNQEYRIVTGSGDIRWIYDRTWIRKDAAGEVTHYQGIVMDITDRKHGEEVLLKKHEELKAAHGELKQAQARVIQQEKLASIGQLAAGITHEINNPMSFITGNLGILRTYLESIAKTIATQEEIAENHAPPEALEVLHDLRKKMKIDYILADVGPLIDQSLEGADRVRKIVSDLKTFSRMEEDAFIIEDINVALDSAITIVWNEIKYKAELVKEFGELPLTRCNISHLSQVFMNLLMNAAQAIEKWGKITVRTWTQGNDIYVSIADTGSGIPEENREKIFEPFFTTKAAGKGTGLGLSISGDIVKLHNGEVTVASKVGEGTTFTVRIPIAGS
ncbi:MAG: ATP-binding protein [Syntrophales bacterium]